MSHANNSNQTEVNGDRLFVNDSDQINDSASGKFFLRKFCIEIAFGEIIIAFIVVYLLLFSVIIEKKNMFSPVLKWDTSTVTEFFLKSISDTRDTVSALHDQQIEENTLTADDSETSKNEENNKRLNLTEFYLLKQNSMAIYYGWQLVCLIIFIFTAYETLQSV